MINYSSLFIILLGVLSTHQILKFFKFNFSKYFVDKPNLRSSHSKKTPTSGGISFVLVSQFLYFFSNNPIPLICLPLAIIGLLDDKFHLSSKFRYFIQIITGFLIAIRSPFYTNLVVNKEVNIFNILVTISIAFAVTIIINLVNFMDGLDGLVAGCMLIGFLALAFLNNGNLFLIVGSLIAFIYWNWHPSKIFMGDIGSTFLAASYAGFILENTDLTKIFIYLSILFPIFADSVSCLIMRILDKQNIFKAHKLHLYQRLHQAGYSHEKVSIIYISSSLLIFLGYLFFDKIYVMFLLLMEFGLGYYLNKFQAIPFSRKNYD